MEPAPWIYPENTVADVFIGPVDSEGNFTQYNVILKDLEGNILQEVIASGDVVTYRDIRSGEESQSPYTPMSVVEYLQSLMNTARYMAEAGWSVIGNGTLEGEDSVVFEKLDDYCNDCNEEYSQGTASSGIVQDLELKQILHKIEVVLDNPLLHTEQVFVIDKQGNSILIVETSYIVVEVIDSNTK
jgi:hypothetical protein